MTENWLKIGRIVAPQGLQGEVRIYPDSDFPERFEEPGDRWLLRPKASQPESIRLIAGRYLSGKGLYAVQFAGVTTREQAEALRDAYLVVEESDRPALEEGEFHVIDLIGLEVFDQPTQKLVGVVTDVFTAGNDLLEVALSSDALEPDSPAKRVLIPFVEAIVPVVDLQQRRVEILPPPGLLDI
jgi:16S rRNA processing protein RimM